jgi:hypothetical protein
MTTVYFCKLDDVPIFCSLSEADCQLYRSDMIRLQAENTLLSKAAIPDSLINKGNNNMLLSTLGITNREILEQMESITNVTCSEVSVKKI